MQDRVKLQSENSSEKSVLLLGTGYVARRLIPTLLQSGYRIAGTYHKKWHNIQNVRMVKFGSANMLAAFKHADIILSSIPPTDLGDPVLDLLSGQDCGAAWVGYLSATSVYGDRQGQWAFEDEPPSPTLRRGRRRAAAEIDWIETGWPVHIFRLAGIYGPQRGPFGKLQKGQARAVIKEDHVVNRIYVDDIVSALVASMQAPNPQRIYNLADGNPTPPQDVLNHAAELAGLSAPKRVAIEEADLSEMARSFYAECKRIDNSRARRELDWSPAYPTYKEGLRKIYSQLSQNAH